jgi:hypothetical protein
LGVSAEQRLLQHFWLSGGVDYADIEYLTTGQSAAVRRKDNNWTYSAALRTTFLRRGTASISYVEAHKHSNLAGFSITTKRIGWSVSYRY